MRYAVKWFAVRLAYCCLSFGLLTLIAGCGDKAMHAVEHMKVSGKVMYQGKPLPGGQVTFVAVNGSFTASAPIDENGDYQIKAPLGEMGIGVDNRMLLPRRGFPITQIYHPKQSGVEAGKEVKGRWVRIPSNYIDPVTSGLKYKVTAGPQTHNIELSASRNHGS